MMMKSLQKGVAFATLVLSTPAALGFSPLLSPIGAQQQSALLKPPVPLSSSSSLFPKHGRGQLHDYHHYDDNRMRRSATENHDDDSSSSSSKREKLFNLITRVQRRFDTCEMAGITDVKKAGLFGLVKKAHNPKTYLAVLALAGFRYSWCFKNIYYWFVVGFCIKWYRARYVFKIPVWDRQPNWNNVITSKEQEKDLKAFTCKNCGSTIFIAKTREFFFEGSTGIGGLGCFSCGAKGADNFVMDRDRIVEDVGEDDDYFDYERPLDFVSRAERRKLMKEAKGDEELANQLLMDRNAASSSTEEGGGEGDDAESAPTVEEAVDVEVEEEESAVIEEETEEGEEEPEEEAVSIEEEEKEGEVEAVVDEEPEVSDSVEPTGEEAPPPPKKDPAKKKAPEPATATDDDFDILGLD